MTATARVRLAYLPDIHAEHLDEAEFLWTQWERAQTSLAVPALDVAVGVEDRLRAHLDGLRVGGADAARELLWPALDDGEAEPARVGSAALALLGGGARATVERLLDALAAAEAPARAALERALAAGDGEHLSDVLLARLPGAATPVQASILRVLARRAVPAGAWLAPLLESPTGEVLAAALGVLRAGAPDVDLGRRVVPRFLANPEPMVAEAAMWAGLRLGLGAAWAACRRATAGASPPSAAALVLLAQGGTDRDLAALIERLGAVADRETTLLALGASGRKDAAAACVPLLADAKAGHLAAEAFSAITGLPVRGPFARPDDPAPDGGDGEVLPQDDLPRPAADAIAEWWQRSEARFDAKERYLMGAPIARADLASAVRTASLRRARLLATELTIRAGAARATLDRIEWVGPWLRQSVASGPLDARELARPLDAVLAG